MRRKTLAITTVAALGIGGAVAWSGHSAPQVEAADHNDPPSVTAGDSTDKAADIADVYLFDRGENTVIVLTYAGPVAPADDQTATYDPDVLYTIHISTDDDITDDEETIHVRFGENSSGNWGMQVTGFPGATGVLTGPAEFANEVPDDGGQFWAGLRDDPFFFDLEGFMDTASSGDLGFSDPPVDFFAGQNVSAIVLEIPNGSIVTGGNTTFNVWASSARIPAS